MRHQRTSKFIAQARKRATNFLLRRNRLQAKLEKKKEVSQAEVLVQAAADVCNICFEDMTMPCRIVGCGHTFCLKCMTKWTERHTTCPMCRGDTAPLTTFSVRRFTLEHWPGPLNLDRNVMADNGFYYTGHEDTVKCCYCYITLWNWDANDKPWEEHKVHSVICPRVVFHHRFERPGGRSGFSFSGQDVTDLN